MLPKHFEQVIALQSLAFPPPFDRDLLWQHKHLLAHHQKFSIGQWIAIVDGHVVGSCSNSILSRDHYDKKLPWKEMVGGYALDTFETKGTILYGLDISVHPDFRKRGIGRAFYDERKMLVSHKKLERYATTCRMPDFEASAYTEVHTYSQDVKARNTRDRTLTPLLRYGLTMCAVLENHWDDPESGNAAALLEWTP